MFINFLGYEFQAAEEYIVAKMLIFKLDNYRLLFQGISEFKFETLQILTKLYLGTSSDILKNLFCYLYP